MLCVRVGAFRVEYRVVLLDENPTALEVVMFTWDTWRSADSRHPLLWRVLRVLSTTSSRRNGALRAGWGFSSRISCGVVR